MAPVGPALPPELLEARRLRREAAKQGVAAQSRPHGQSTSTGEHDHEIREDAADQVDPAKQIIPVVIDRDSASRSQLNLDDKLENEKEDEDEDEDEDDEESIGPMLPGDEEQLARYPASNNVQTQYADKETTLGKDPAVELQNNWLFGPVSASERGQSIDTTKLKSRTFANHGPKNVSLEYLRASSTQQDSQSAPSKSQDGVTQDATRLPVSRGPSLYDQYTEKRRKEGNDEDDVSKRPFDREKDIGGQVSSKRSRTLAKESHNLSSMFETGKFV